jgi:hypothetical protein
MRFVALLALVLQLLLCCSVDAVAAVWPWASAVVLVTAVGNLS